MKTIPAPLSQHLQQDTTTLTLCFEISRLDGQVFRFTTLDEDVTVDGQTYETASGATPSQLNAKADLSVDNLDFTAILDSQTLLREDLLYGAFDYARVKIFLVNWADTAQGTLTLATGVLGEVRLGDVQFTAEMRSLTQHLQSTHGRIVALECDVEIFGEGRCGLDKLNFAEDTTVTGIVKQYMTFQTGSSQLAGYYTAGELRFDSGANQGASYSIAEHTSGGTIRIAARTPRAINVNDQVRLIAGCDRRFSTCRDKFANTVNFQGFPHVPGRDAIFETPDAK